MNEDYLKKSKKKKNKVVIIFIILFILCVLGLGGFIAYDKYFSKEPVKKTIKKSTETNKVEKQEISDIKVVLEETDDNDMFRLIGKKDNNWIELASVNYSSDESMHYYGTANDKIYYYVHGEGFKYIDLYDESLQPKLWLEDKAESTSQGEMSGKFEGSGDIFGDSIYMIVPGDTFYSIPLNSKSLKEAKIIITSTDDTIIENEICLINNYMFYDEYNNEGDKTTVVKYDIKSGKKKKITKNDSDYSLYDQYLIIHDNGKVIKINKNNMQQEDVTNLIKGTDSYEFIDNILFYVKDGYSLMKNENGKTTTIYKEKEEYGIGDFTVIDENTFVIESDPASGGSGESAVIQNGKKLSKTEVKELKKKYTVDVTLKDGTKKALFIGLDALWEVDND